jgi:hypothetical protein
MSVFFFSPIYYEAVKLSVKLTWKYQSALHKTDQNQVDDKSWWKKQIWTTEADWAANSTYSIKILNEILVLF